MIMSVMINRITGSKSSSPIEKPPTRTSLEYQRSKLLPRAYHQVSFREALVGTLGYQAGMHPCLFCPTAILGVTVTHIEYLAGIHLQAIKQEGKCFRAWFQIAAFLSTVGIVYQFINT